MGWIWVPYVEDIAGVCTLKPRLCSDSVTLSYGEPIPAALVIFLRTVVVKKLRVSCACKDVELAGWRVAL